LEVVEERFVVALGEGRGPSGVPRRWMEGGGGSFAGVCLLIHASPLKRRAVCATVHANNVRDMNRRYVERS
jgi:hypothetical protein